MKVRDLIVLLETTAVANLEMRFEVVEREGKVTVSAEAGFMETVVQNGEIVFRLSVPPLHAEDYRAAPVRH